MLNTHVQMHEDAIKTSGHSSFEKYTSHFIERVVCERDLETEQRLQHIEPPTLQAITAFLSRSPGLLNLCWDMVLIPASSLQLMWTSCRWGYIIIWHPPTSCKRHNSHLIQPLESQGHPLISSTGCTCYLHRCISSFDSLARVNMQHQVPFLKSLKGSLRVTLDYSRQLVLP